MKTFTSFTLLILISQISFAQAKKKAVTTKPEIDQLYSKYKESEQITLYTAFGELTGDINCKLNLDNKPESIEIKIETENREAAARFIADLIQQKLKNNYRDGNTTYSTSWQFESIKSALDIPEQFEEMREPFYFTKKSMYTKIEYSCSNSDSRDLGTITYHISIVTGDKSRAGGKKATKFEF